MFAGEIGQTGDRYHEGFVILTVHAIAVTRLLLAERASDTVARARETGRQLVEAHGTHGSCGSSVRCLRRTTDGPERGIVS